MQRDLGVQVHESQKASIKKCQVRIVFAIDTLKVWLTDTFIGLLQQHFFNESYENLFL